MFQSRVSRLTFALAVVFVLVFPGTMPARAEAPANDNFADATMIESFPFDALADLTEATFESTDPTPGCGEELGKTVWYRYTPDADILIEYDLWDAWPEQFDVSVYRQTLGELELLGCAMYWYDPNLTLWLTAGEDYYFMINTPSSETTTVRLQVIQIPPPPNDHFSQATPASLPFYQSADIRAATLDPGEPTPSCVSGSMGRTFWITFTPDVVGSILAYNANWSNSFWAMYTGDMLENLNELYCSASGERPMLEVLQGQMYYFQVGSINGDAGWADFYLNFFSKPINDDFADAIQVDTLPFQHGQDIMGATKEDGEKMPSCAFDVSGWTVWYAFTPTGSKSYLATLYLATYNAYPFVAVWTGGSLSDLTEQGCAGWGAPLAVRLEEGVTYYFQVGVLWDGGNWLDFYLNKTPPPSAEFYYWPGDPTLFDTINFSDSSYDPANVGIASCTWDFGDGSTSNECNPAYHFGKDGSYTVAHGITTTDGRSASISKVIQVRTHDIAIIKFSVPKSASAAQTRTITVGLQNLRYEETVEVHLYKSTPGGWMEVGVLTQYVPKRAGYRTTDFLFSYTFTPNDAKEGKVVFRAVAIIQSLRDALPADNEAVSQPVKISR